MTNWSIRVLNIDAFPYAWDLVDNHTVGSLDQAYHIYQQTGSLTSSIPSAQLDSSTSEANPKGVRQPSHSLRQPPNGSQKRRVRKKKATEADVGISETTVEAASSITKQTVDTTALSIVQSPSLELTTVHPIETSTEHRPLDLETDHVRSAMAKAITEDPTTSNGAINVISIPQEPDPTSAQLATLSPAHKNEVLHVPDSIHSPGPFPTKHSNAQCVNDPVVSDSVEQRSADPSSPGSSSVTLAPASDESAVEHVEHVEHLTGAIGDANGDSSHLQSAKRKRRSKKGKSTKTKSEIVQSVASHHDTGPEAIVQAETEEKLQGQEQIEHEVACRPEETPVESPSSDVNRFNLNRGRWHTMGDSYAIFTNNTGTVSLHTRTPRIERYLRQQERILAARVEIEERPKQAKAKNQARKARKLLLRRDHIAADSPLLRAMERPRDCAKKSARQRSQSPIRKVLETIVEVQKEYRRVEGEKQKIRQQMEACGREIQRAVELQDGEERDDGDQPSSRNPGEDFCFDFETDISDDDNDSGESLIPERLESNPAEGFEKAQQESDTAIFVAKVDRYTGPHVLSFRFRSKESDPERFETMSPSTSEEDRHSTENDSAVGSESLIEENTAPKLDTPAMPAFVSPAKQNGLVHDYQIETKTSVPEKEKLCEESFSCIVDKEQATGNTNEKNSSGSTYYHDVYPDASQHHPTLQSHNASYDFVRPVTPASLDMSSKALLTQRIANEHSFERAQSSAESSQLGETQSALENDQRFRESDVDTSGMGGHSMMEANLAGAEDHRRVLRDNQRGRWSGQRGRLSRRGRGSHYRAYRGDDTPSMAPRAENVENAWAAAVQKSDRELNAQRVERRIELEQHMQATGTTYTDYAGSIEDSYVQLDEDRKPVDEKVEQIIYGPSSGSPLPSDCSVPMQETAKTGPSEVKDSEVRDDVSG